MLYVIIWDISQKWPQYCKKYILIRLHKSDTVKSGVIMLTVFPLVLLRPYTFQPFQACHLHSRQVENWCRNSRRKHIYLIHPIFSVKPVRQSLCINDCNNLIAKLKGSSTEDRNNLYNRSSRSNLSNAFAKSINEKKCRFILIHMATN